MGVNGGQPDALRGRRVLLVSHDASRTGAPSLLAAYGRWLHDEAGIEVATLLLGGGPLTSRFAELGPVRLVDLGDRRRPTGVVAAALTETGLDGAAAHLLHARARLACRRLGPVDAAWLSAAPSLHVLPALARDLPVVAHVHELQGVLDHALGTGAAATELLERCDRLVAGTPEIRDLLVQRGAYRERVRVCDEFVPDPPPGQTTRDRQAGPALRAELGIPSGAPVVLAVATPGRRKGIDLFVVLARLLGRRPRGSSAHLVWVGGAPGDLAWDEAQADVAAAGLGDRVHLVGEQNDLGQWFGMADVAVLTSREDSFPLVCLLAGLHEVPVVAFDTGIGDLLRRAGQSGAAVAHLDLVAMADQVEVLLDDETSRRAAGAALAREIRSRHLTTVAAPALAGVLVEAIADGTGHRR